MLHRLKAYRIKKTMETVILRKKESLINNQLH